MCRLYGKFASYFSSYKWPYCHLVWHFCRASDSRKLEQEQERALRAIYCDRSSSYEKLLNMANLCILRNRRLHDIPGHMYRKVKNNICPKHIADLFQGTDTKYLLTNEEFVILRRNTITHRKRSIRYIGPELWNPLPKKVREFPTLSVFKQQDFHAITIYLGSTALWSCE